ncbi:MAG: hypothetical protein ABSF22_20920 [Bryobacteraceae bacterium]
MRSIIFAVVLFAGAAGAEEFADRAAIEKTISALNVWPVRADIFTADFDGRQELARLAQNPQVVAADAKPSVEISKEPWGEATISLPGMILRISPAIVTKKIRFLSADVAMVDAVGKGPLLFVLKREGTDWKIASLRILAEK